jgi:drug/metabolite transporter (DMT)-like permease
MQQNSPGMTSKSAVSGAVYMVAAGCAFAIANVITRHVTYGLGLSSTSESFWQYGIALVFSLPLLWSVGLGAMRTSRPFAHLIRVVLSVLGVQAFVYGFAHGVSFGQVMALVMTSPFFINAGAALFLGEKVGAERWLATAIGFAGAVVILQPWSSDFTIYALAPVAAAILWGASSLVTKSLLAKEQSSTVTIWLLLLIAPANFGFAVAGGFQLPTETMIPFLVLSGFVMALSQYWLVKAYEVADATYVQPFDDLKLPVNFFLGWVFLGETVSSWLWLGAIMILGASAYNMQVQARRERQAKPV